MVCYKLLSPFSPQALASALQSAAPSLTPAHAIDAAWGLGVTGAGTKVS